MCIFFLYNLFFFFDFLWFCFGFWVVEYLLKLSEELLWEVGVCGVLLEFCGGLSLGKDIVEIGLVIGEFWVV